MKKLLLTIMFCLLATGAWGQSFPTTPILDSFNRADEGPPPSATWTDNALGEGADNQLKVVSNALVANTIDTSCESWWNLSSFGSDIEVYATINTKSGDAQRFELGFLQNPGVLNTKVGYMVHFVDSSGTDTIKLQRMDAPNTATQLGSTVNQEFSVGDIIGLSKVGTTLTVYRNGSAVITETDSTYSGSMYLYAGIRSTTGVLDDFGGGNWNPHVLIIR
jgi:hypothetical protein